MANPFEVRVPNALESLMSFDQGYASTRGMMKEQAIKDAGEALQSGNYDAATAALFKAGNFDAGLSLIKLRQQQNASDEFSRDLSGRLGFPQPVRPSSVATPTAPSQPGVIQRLMQPQGVAPQGTMPATAEAPARPMVASTNRVVGDEEAIRDGLYERPQRVAQAPQVSPTGNMIGSQPLSAAMPALLRAATNPNLSKEQQETARMLIGKALDQFPKDVQELEALRQRPDLFKMELERRRASATAITNDMRGENAESSAIGKAAGERAGATVAAASAATKTLAGLSRVNALLDSVQQGKIEPARMTISAWAKSLGLEDGVSERLGLDPKKVGDAQALAALTNESVISKIGAGGFPANNFSDADRSFLVSTVPQLGNDPRANKIIIETARRVAQRDIEKGQAWLAFRRDPANKGKGFDDFDVQWAGSVAKQDALGDLRREAEALIGARPQSPPPAGSRTQSPYSPEELRQEIERRGLGRR